MIKLKELLKEEYKHPIFGSDKSYWTVVKPIDVLVRTSDWEKTSQSYQHGGRSSRLYKNKPIKMKMLKGIQISNLPGGLFAIDYKHRQAYAISKVVRAKKSDVEPRNSKIIDFTLWKKWPPYKALK